MDGNSASDTTAKDEAAKDEAARDKTQSGGVRGARRSTAVRQGEIAAAALSCLTQYGYAGLTARRVAARAGISLGRLTYHFNNMDEVMIAAYHLAAEKLAQTEALGDLKGLTASERFVKFLQSVYAPQTLTDDLIRLRVDLWSAAQAIPAVAHIERSLHAAIGAKVEAHLIAMCDPWKTGRIPMVQAFVMAMLDGLWLDYMRHGDIEAIDAAIETASHFVKMRLGGT